MLKLRSALLALSYIDLASAGLNQPFWSGGSARTANLCNTLYGAGETGWVTASAICSGYSNVITLYCAQGKAKPESVGPGFVCPRGYTCIDQRMEMNPADAGCYKLDPIEGYKTAGNQGKVACSPGLTVGAYPMWISTHVTGEGLQGCWVKKSGTEMHLMNQFSCDGSSVNVQFEAHTTYQACVQVDPALQNKQTPFTWFFGTADQSQPPSKEDEGGIESGLGI